jgi:hypothetical protein
MIRYLMPAFFLIGCAGSPSQPDLEVKWDNKKLITDVRAGKIAMSDFDGQLVMDKNGCMIEAMKIPIPSPSCTQRSSPGSFNTGNSVLNSYMAGAAATRGPDCDYSSVKYAHKAQEQVFFSCMTLRGWDDIWLIKGTNKIVPKPKSRSIQ